jgi:hypothetical protein
MTAWQERQSLQVRRHARLAGVLLARFEQPLDAKVN